MKRILVNRSIDLPTNDPRKVIEVKVRYSKHDGSYHDPRAEKQGYWVNVTPVEVDDMFRTTTAYTGTKRFIEGAKRFGAKKLDTIFASVKSEILTGHTEDSFVRMVLNVAESNNLTITQWSQEKG